MAAAQKALDCVASDPEERSAPLPTLDATLAAVATARAVRCQAALHAQNLEALKPYTENVNPKCKPLCMLL